MPPLTVALHRHEYFPTHSFRSTTVSKDDAVVSIYSADELGNTIPGYYSRQLGLQHSDKSQLPSKPLTHFPTPLLYFSTLVFVAPNKEYRIINSSTQPACVNAAH